MYERPTGPTATYKLYGAEDALLYVGITCQPEARLKQHEETQSWWPEVQRHTVEWFDTRIEARRTERAAIRNDGPRYNRQDRRRISSPGRGPYATAQVTKPARDALDDLVLLASRPRRRPTSYSMSVAILAALPVIRNHLDEYEATVAIAQADWERQREAS